jgi:phage terminase large subunit GpA-like protein
MNCMIHPDLRSGQALASRLTQARLALKPPPILDLVEWADTYRKVASKTSASPGQWQTNAQPVAFGPMRAVTEPDTHTVSVMAGTQVVKTELLINVAGFFIHQDPGSILFVQPTQGAAEAFSKERFAPTVEVTPALSELIAKPRTRDSENTIAHKSYRGGSLDFVGANSPTDLASRPKRVILCDEIDKYPPSAGGEGDPLLLAEERASTYKAVGRSKSVRTCSPTEEGVSRIGREYAASDQRRCYVACPHCGHSQLMTWAQVTWSKDAAGGHLPESAGIQCSGPDCGVIWTEGDRIAALDALEHAPDHGWRQTRQFVCCEVVQTPERWTKAGRSRCQHCDKPTSYGGHAGFHISKLYSKRHRLPDLVQEFLDAKADPESLKKFTNTGLAELWRPVGRESLDGTGLIARAELYGPDDLPDEVRVITGFCDVQGDRLEIQLVAWGPDEEAWPFLYEIIHLDPAQPQVWRELDTLRARAFRTRGNRILRIAAFGVDTGGHHTTQVHAYCRLRRKQRVFATQGHASKPLWTNRSSRSKNNDPLWHIGTNAAKDAIYARLRIDPPEEPGQRRPGFIHFPQAENFGPEYFEQLTVERREIRYRSGQPYVLWICPKGKRNEVLDTFVGALAVRRALPARIERSLEFGLAEPAAPSANDAADGEAPPSAQPRPKYMPRRRGFLNPNR